MSKIRSKNTKPEVLVFRELRKRGIYFQKHYKRAAGNPDIALPRKKKAVFIDGDFWHGYQFSKLEKRLPKKYWLAKIERNIKRDRKNRAQLHKEGWEVLRVWEHELNKNFDNALEKIIKFLESPSDIVNNVFLDRQWQKLHLKKIKERAGNRYTPELNVNLPIAEIFDGISRTENFYTSIRKHYGKLDREFSRVSKKYENDDIQKLYKNLKGEISRLSKILGMLKEYNTKKIPWDKINKLAKRASDTSWKLSNKLREEKYRAEKQKTQEAQGDQRSASEKFGSDIHYLYETQKELRYFKELSSSTKVKLSNSPFLFLTGIAGTGKTHLLCDVAENRITSKKSLPAVLVFGELFATSDDPFTQIIRQLGLKTSKNQFIRLLNNAGKKSYCRAILAIDALNETRQRTFWKRSLEKVVKEIKK